jgi:hypothetical protein
MVMTTAQALSQLRSEQESTVQGVLKHLSRGGLGTVVPEQVRDEIVRLHRRRPTWAKEFVEVIVAFPCSQFKPLYLELFNLGGIWEQQRAVESVPLWIRSSVLGFAEVAAGIEKCRRSLSPWVRFLAAVQSARFDNEPGRYWHDAALEIDRADRQEWQMGIRSQALEVLSESEIDRVTAELIGTGRRPLRNRKPGAESV